MDGTTILSGLTRLSGAETMKQVRPLSYALFPGYHCPLMGAMLTIKEIEEAVMLVVGPDECAFYTQLATSGGGMKARGCHIASVVLDQHDVTFGSQQKMDAAFAELMEEYNPRLVYLVTTCVVEVTGDDMDAMAQAYSARYGLPVLVVHAENFKTDDHLPGIEHTLEASLQVMEAREAERRVNVLGLRLGDFTKTEVCRLLEENGVGVGLTLPGHTSVEVLKDAPGAACNLVVHPVGLPLARAMQARFGTPFVLFERVCDPRRILACYRALFDCLSLPLPGGLEAQCAKLEAEIERLAPRFRGRSYVSGNTALCNWELHDFLAGRLGLRPLLLQISELDEVSRPYREALLRVCDPYVTRAANLTAMSALYPVLRPDYNIGAADPVALRRQGVVSIGMQGAYDMLGFDVCGMLLCALRAAENERGGAK